MVDQVVFPHFRHFTTFLLGLSATLFLCENEIRASRAFLEFRKSVLSYSDAMTKMLAQNMKCLQFKYIQTKFEPESKICLHPNIRLSLPLHSVELDTSPFAHQCFRSYYLNEVKARNKTLSSWGLCKLNRGAQYSQLLKLWQHLGAAWKRGAVKM